MLFVFLQGVYSMESERKCEEFINTLTKTHKSLQGIFISPLFKRE